MPAGLPATPLDAEVALVLQALRVAVEILGYLGPASTSKPLIKPDWTPVTLADFAIQAAVARMIQASFPSDSLAAEEDSRILASPKRHRQLDEVVGAVRRVHPSAEARDVLSWLDWRGPQAAGRQWAFDPIDGTRGLLRGGQYVTALALIADGEVDLGAMACPRYDGFGSGGAFAVAVRRCGAWARGAGGGTWRRLAMASELDGKPRMIRSVESGWKTSRRLARLGKDLGIEPKELRMDSQVKYLALAAGEGDLVVRLPRRKGTVRENVWDHAAGVLLVEEAGGVVSDVHGTPLDFGAGTTLSRNLGVLASIAGLHERAVRAVGRVLD